MHVIHDQHAASTTPCQASTILGNFHLLTILIYSCLYAYPQQFLGEHNFPEAISKTRLLTCGSRVNKNVIFTLTNIYAKHEVVT